MGRDRAQADRPVETGEPHADEESDFFDPDDESLEDDELDELVN